MSTQDQIPVQYSQYFGDNCIITTIPNDIMSKILEFIEDKQCLEPKIEHVRLNDMRTYIDYINLKKKFINTKSIIDIVTNNTIIPNEKKIETNK